MDQTRTQLLQDLESLLNNAHNHSTPLDDKMHLFTWLVNELESRTEDALSQVQDKLDQTLKMASAIRILTRSKLIVSSFDGWPQFVTCLVDLIDSCEKHLSQPDSHILVKIIIEVFATLKRIVFHRQDLIHPVCTERNLQLMIKPLKATSYSRLVVAVLDFLDFLHDFLQAQPDLQQLVVRELSQLFYLGKLIFIIEKNDEATKKVAVNLITKLLENDRFQETFRTIQGASTIIAELQKSVSQQLRIPLLNCILKIVQRSENIFDLKVYGVVLTLQTQLEDSRHYMVVVTTINILCYLSLDEDLSLKIMDKCVGPVVKLLFDSINKQLQFQDVSGNDIAEAVQELQIYCFKLLRFLYSNNRNRQTIKGLLTPRLLQIFIDVGNYVRSLSSYKKVMLEFNRMSSEDLQAMEARYTQMFEAEDSQYPLLEPMISVRQYSLGKAVGKGAFGEVFVCYQGENKYALKRMSLTEMQKSQDHRSARIGKVHQEVEIHKILFHPNIVRFYEAFQHEEYFCLILEHVDGVNLAEFISSFQEKGQRIPESIIWKILIHLCTTLKYLHCDLRIVHRDLNPANIMITLDQEIKLCDFGLAKYIDEQPDSMLNSFVGTLVYSCPEIIENLPYNEGADVWALGCIAYELVTLKSTFISKNPLVLAKKICSVEYEPIEQQFYSEDLLEFISMCLVKVNRPNILQLLKRFTIKLVDSITSIQISQQTLTETNTLLQKKIDRHKPETGPKKLRIPATGLREVDPVAAMLDLIRRVLRVTLLEVKEQDMFKRYIVEQFYSRLLLGEEATGESIKLHLLKLHQLSKEVIQGVWVHFQGQSQITYEQLNFYVQELNEKYR